MANRASGIAKTPALVKLSRAERADGVGAAPAMQRPIPLDLTPLLAPYKKRGRRLSLRIERIPQRARLSAGRNRGDGSWSLAPDELEDLTYQIPEGIDDAHTLALRVINLDGDTATTLAVVDFMVSPGVGLAANEDKPRPVVAAIVRHDPELLRLRDELAAAKSELAAREVELAEARQAPPRGARTARDEAGILDDRLAAAAAQASADLAQGRAAWETQQNARLATLEERARQQLADAQERWQREAKATLANAEEAWKAGEAVRIAALEARLAEKSKTASGKSTQGKQTADHAAELKRLTEIVTTLQTTVAERETALARAAADAEEARDVWQDELQETLSRAEHARKIEEAARVAQQDAQWQEKLTKALAEARAKTGAARDREHAIELGTLREKLLAMETDLADRDAALAQANAEIEETRDRVERETTDAALKAARAGSADALKRLKTAEVTWKEDSAKAVAAAVAWARSEGANQLAAAEAKWQEQSAKDAASAREEREKLEAALTEARAEIDTQLAALDAKWQTRVGSEGSAAQAEHERLEAALNDARAEGAAQLAAAEARWQKNAAKDAAAIQSLREQADAALNEARAEAKAQLTALEAKWQDMAARNAADSAAAQEQAQAVVAQVRADAAAQLAEAEAKWQARAAADAAVLGQTDAALTELSAEADAKLAKLSAEAAETLAAAETRWRAQTSNEVAVYIVQRERAEAELVEARAEAAARIAETEADLKSRAAKEISVATARCDLLESALAEARADADSRVTAAERKARKEVLRATADATARFEAAEAALAQLRIKAHAVPDHDPEIERLRDENSMLQAALTARDAELVGANAAIRNSYGRPDPRANIVLRGNKEYDEADAAEAARLDQMKRRRRVVIGGIGAAVFAAAAIVFVVMNMGSVVGGKSPSPSAAATVAAADAGTDADTDAAAPHMALVVHDARIRSKPSTTAATVAALRKGSQVAVVEQRGSWTHVRLNNAAGAAQEGWVYSSLLKDAVPAANP